MKRFIGLSPGGTTFTSICSTILHHITSLSCALLTNNNPFSCGILSSAVSQYLSSSVIPCSVLFLPWSSIRTVLPPGRRILSQPFSNPLKVALGVPSRGHSLELSCKRLSRCCENKCLDDNGCLFLTLGNVFIEGCSATDRSGWLSRKPVWTVRYLGIDISLCSGIAVYTIYRRPPRSSAAYVGGGVVRCSTF
jgi:hypothetical protein